MTPADSGDAMYPLLGRLVSSRDMGHEIKLLGVKVLNGTQPTFPVYAPGQFAFLSAFGIGEAPFGLASTSERGEVLEFAVQRLGSVTTGLHELAEGDALGVRGPMGNAFPMEQFHHKNLLVLGGGIGGAPLRPVIHSVARPPRAIRPADDSLGGTPPLAAHLPRRVRRVARGAPHRSAPDGR
jgi:NAD(P)H-flavin reductase